MWCRFGRTPTRSLHRDRAQQQSQLSPFQLSNPSRPATAAMTNAAAGSARRLSIAFAVVAVGASGGTRVVSLEVTSRQIAPDNRFNLPNWPNNVQTGPNAGNEPAFSRSLAVS